MRTCSTSPGRWTPRRGHAAPPGPVNTARFLFLDPRAPEFRRDWEGTANDVVALLRTEAGRDPHDRDLCDLVGELSTRSEEFRTRWARHDLRLLASWAATLTPQASASSS